MTALESELEATQAQLAGPRCRPGPRPPPHPNWCRRQFRRTPAGRPAGRSRRAVEVTAVRIVGAEAIHRLLDFPSLIEALREMFRDGAEVPPRHHHAIDRRAAAGRQPRHLAADAGVAERGGARRQDRHRVSRQRQARAALGLRDLSAARRRDRRARSRARRHGADLAPHRGRLGARRFVSRAGGQRGASDGRHRRARAVSDRGAWRGAADPRDPDLGTRSAEGRRPGRAPCRCRDRRGRRTRSRRGRGGRRHHHLRDPVAGAAGARRVAQTRRASRPGRRLPPGHAREPTTPRSAAPASLSIPRRRCTRPATSSSRCAPACSRATASPATCSGWRAGPARAGEPPTRSRCSNRSAPRSKTSPPPSWRLAALESENIVANFAKFIGSMIDT